MVNDPTFDPGGRADPTEVLAEAARALHGETNLDRLIGWASEAACRVTGATQCSYVSISDAGDGPLASTPGAESLHSAAIVEPLERLLTGGGCLRIPDLVDDTRFDRVAAHRGSPTAGELVRSLLGCAVVAPDSHRLGILLAAHSQPGRFTFEDEEALSALAAHVGVALANRAALAQLAAAQREIVHQLQESVLPPVPAVPQTELGRHYVGADSPFSTGGDLYDWLLLPDGDLHVAVVDIMGKGVSATKDALAVTHVLRLLVLDGCPLERLVERADEIVASQNPELVATLMVARYTPSTGLTRLVGAGHPPALLVTGDKVLELSAPGVPIGWPGASSDQVVETVLDRADTLILYTDGLIESTRDIVQGLESLEQAAAETAGYPARNLARALVDRALAGAVRHDDSLAVVVRRRIPPEGTHYALAPFEYRFSPHTATISLARNLLRDWLVRVPVEDSTAHDLVLVASELCTNAVRHASGAPGSVSLRAWAEEADVMLEVEDDGGDLAWPMLDDDDMPDPELEAGRGLFLVEALTDGVTTETGGGRTLVRCVKRAVVAETGVANRR